jgi:hypothetical protein
MRDARRGRFGRGWVLGVAAAGLAAAIASCADFRGSAAGPDAGGDDGGLTDATQGNETGPADGGGLTDGGGGGPDTSTDAPAEAETGGGDSPPDYACTGAWTHDLDGGCAARRVVVLEPGILDTTALAVAVTGTRRVGVAYNSKLFADQGELHVAHFGKPTGTDPDGGLTPSPQIAVIAGSQFDNVGFVADIAASAGARLHLAYQAVPDNQINYATLDETGPPSTAETVTTGIALPSDIALGVLPSGDVRATYYDPAQGILSSKVRTVASGWQPASQIPQAFATDGGVAGIGQVSQVIDDVGSVHVAYDFSPLSGITEARYSQYAGPLWGDPKQLENLNFAGQSGFSIALGITGQTRHAAYFVIPTGATTADLHLASWIGQNDPPTIEIVAQQLPSSATPTYRVALATDAWGLLHLAIVHPQDVGKGYLEYRRQRRSGGQVSWVSDIVDDAVLDASPGSGQTLVDIAVDADGRPHIAYYRGTDGSVCYATRFDR